MQIHVRCWRAATLVALLFAYGTAIAQSATPATQADAGETRRLHALFDADWQWRLRTYPEWATYRGVHRYGGRLNDRSRQAEDKGYAHARERLARLRTIDPARLAATDRVSYDILLANTL